VSGNRVPSNDLLSRRGTVVRPRGSSEFDVPINRERVARLREPGRAGRARRVIDDPNRTRKSCSAGQIAAWLT